MYSAPRHLPQAANLKKAFWQIPFLTRLAAVHRDQRLNAAGLGIVEEECKHRIHAAVDPYGLHTDAITDLFGTKGCEYLAARLAEFPPETARSLAEASYWILRKQEPYRAPHQNRISSRNG